jgi:hypothetical protein
MDILAGREIIFEFRASGGAAQVCAVDCATAIEVFVTTPANAMRIDQQNLALRKLARVLLDQGILQVPDATSMNNIGQEKSGLPSRAPLSSKRGFLA